MQGAGNVNNRKAIGPGRLHARSNHAIRCERAKIARTLQIGKPFATDGNQSAVRLGSHGRGGCWVETAFVFVPNDTSLFKSYDSLYADFRVVKRAWKVRSSRTGEPEGRGDFTDTRCAHGRTMLSPTSPPGEQESIEARHAVNFDPVRRVVESDQGLVWRSTQATPRYAAQVPRIRHWEAIQQLTDDEVHRHAARRAAAANRR